MHIPGDAEGYRLKRCVRENGLRVFLGGRLRRLKLKKGIGINSLKRSR